MATFPVCMLTLIVLLAAVAAFATTTTTTVEIVNSGESRGRCRQQIERQRLSSCEQYLRDSSRFELMPENEGGGWREEFPRCCEELEQINEQCRCEAVKQVCLFITLILELIYILVWCFPSYSTSITWFQSNLYWLFQFSQQNYV